MIATTVKKLVSVRDDEVSAMLLATAYGFCILLSYYIIRPVRDEISSADRGNLQYLWTAVFLVMVFVAVPLYSAVVSRYSRGVFIPLANRFFAANLLIFYAVLYALPENARPWIDRVFYVWASVFALFVVTVFWGFMVDLFTNEQGKRLFGFIVVGSSLGGIIGSVITASLIERISFTVLLIAVVLLEAAARCATILHRKSSGGKSAIRREETEPIRGGALSGIPVVFQSPYLRRIALFIALMTFASTILYFQQAQLVGEAFVDNRLGRTAFFAKIDLAVNIITIFTQAFLTAHIIRRIGIGLSLALVPAVALLGFFGLGVYPLLGVLVVLQVLYRSGRYAITKPAREVLFTVVSREEKYKSKPFLDTAVYRGGDLISGWIYTGLAFVGLSLGAIALVAVPFAAVWVFAGLALGRRQENIVRERGAVATDVA
ncbi:MAG: MFS transporter [Gemmatimonadetes bacterium]|nr:MFS transporter [Gemmatimonadota bacterium]